MKKVVALLLIVVLVFSFAACKKTEEVPETTTGVPFDKEVLESNWQDGTITFENGKTLKLPCTVREFVEASELTLQNADKLAEKELKKDEQFTARLFKGTDTDISITGKNIGNDVVSFMDAKVTKYSFKRGGSDSLLGNKKLKFAGTLTVNASRTDVEEVLGEGKEGYGGIITYEGKNSGNRKVQMKISYGDNNLINNVSFELVY